MPSLVWEADSCLTSRKVSRLLWELKFKYVVHEDPTVFCPVSYEINPYPHILFPYDLFYIIFRLSQPPPFSSMSILYLSAVSNSLPLCV